MSVLSETGTITESRVFLPLSFLAEFKASSGTVIETCVVETSSFSPGIKSHLTFCDTVSWLAPLMSVMFVNSVGGIP